MTDATVIADNNPNSVWGIHVIEVVLKQWTYERTLTARVGGNCQGFDIMDTAIGQIHEQLAENRDGQTEVTLTDAAGDTLLCTDDDDRGESWLRPMVVACRIVAFEPPTLNEMRRRNGAKPVVDGDRPWPALGS